MNFGKIDFDKQIEQQQQLLDLHRQLQVALADKIKYLSQAEDSTTKECFDDNMVPVTLNRAIDKADTQIRLWHVERKIEAEAEAQRQLQERRDAQEQMLRDTVLEAENKFTALWARYDRAVERIGEQRLKTDSNIWEVVQEIRKRYDNKFEEEGIAPTPRERKAFCYRELKAIVEQLGRAA